MRQLLSIALACLLPAYCFSQTTHTLYLRSNPDNAQWAYIDGGDPGICIVSNSAVVADWTSSGEPYTWQFLLQFDMSAVPADAVINSAYLSLWANLTSPSGYSGRPMYGTGNATYINRIVDPWSTTTLTWMTPPGFSMTHPATLAQSTATDENYLNQNVTAMVQDMFQYEGNHGFLFRMVQETTPYNSMIFCSPEYYTTDTSMSPLLVVTYTTNTGVNEVNTEREALTVEPNPATNQIIATYGAGKFGKASLVLMDMTGRILIAHETTLTGQNYNETLPVLDLPRGTYLLRLTTGSEVSMKKVILN